MYLLIASFRYVKATFSKYEYHYYQAKHKGRFSFSVPPQLGNNFFIDLRDSSRIIFKGIFTARGNFSIIGRNSAKIEIGNNVFFNLGCSISSLDSVTIGNNVMFGENVKIYDHNHQYREEDKLISEQGYTMAPVIIGDNCWIGTNVVILKGIRIGNNVVIGANVVVKQDIQPGQVVYNKQILESFKI
jgi:acetyltransferase-like isoleucine patch superfamily enzyme